MLVTRSRLLVAALCSGYFLVLLDVTAVNVALPSVGLQLHAAGTSLAWIVDAYTIPLAALVLVAGAIGDRLGHRRIVLIGFAGFGCASVVCALAPILGILLVGRSLQGVTAALMLPGTLAMISDIADDDAARTRAAGVWATIGGAALPAGPLIGGAVTQALGWPAVFWLNLPVCVAAIAVVAASSAPRSRIGSARVDWSGAALLTALIGLSVAAVLRIPHDPTMALFLTAGAVVAAAALIVTEKRSTTTLLDAGMGAARLLWLAAAVAGLMNLCTVGALYLLTQLLQTHHHLDPFAAGLVLLPAMLPLPLLGGAGAWLCRQVGAWRTATVGLLAASAGFGWIALSINDSHPVLFAAAFAVWGSGIGLLTPAIVTAALHAAPGSPGAASGASNTARQFGAAVGVALFAAIAGDAMSAGFADRVHVILIGSACAFLCAVPLCLWANYSASASRS